MDPFLRFQLLMERRQQTFGGSDSLQQCRFESDNGQVPQLRYARTYAQQWNRMSQQNIGLLFWGSPGSGKTFAAAAIANALIESGDAPTVIMATFGTILRQLLARSPVEKDQYISSLLDCGLLILDDFGMERQTDYAREQIFNIVDGRYLAGKPLIVTTNLTLTQLRSPQTLPEERIYDRILEMCVPVCFHSPSFRKEKGEQKLELFRSMTEQAPAPPCEESGAVVY